MAKHVRVHLPSFPQPNPFPFHTHHINPRWSSGVTYMSTQLQVQKLYGEQNLTLYHLPISLHSCQPRYQ